MPTTNPRINMTLDKDTAAMLAFLAKRQSKSRSATARDLLIRAIADEEDIALSMMAEKRLARLKRTIPADKVWD